MSLGRIIHKALYPGSSRSTIVVPKHLGHSYTRKFVLLADETLANEKKLSANQTLTANERLSETSQNLSLAITLSLAVAKIVGMLNCSPNSLHSTDERF